MSEAGELYAECGEKAVANDPQKVRRKRESKSRPTIHIAEGKEKDREEKEKTKEEICMITAQVHRHPGLRIEPQSGKSINQGGEGGGTEEETRSTQYGRSCQARWPGSSQRGAGRRRPSPLQGKGGGVTVCGETRGCGEKKAAEEASVKDLADAIRETSIG